MIRRNPNNTNIIRAMRRRHVALTLIQRKIERGYHYPPVPPVDEESHRPWQQRSLTPPHAEQ